MRLVGKSGEQWMTSAHRKRGLVDSGGLLKTKGYQRLWASPAYRAHFGFCSRMISDGRSQLL
jgi:hypothetical protein